MNRLIAYLIALVVLCTLAYAVYANAPRIPAPTEKSGTLQVGTAMHVATEFADTAAYHVEARYPQFGIPLVDEKVKATVDSAIADFKSIPPNPPGSATPKNEFIGSFDTVYVGSDVVSVELLFSQDTGGAHPNTVAVSVNVDPKTGNDVTLDDALALTGMTLEQTAAQSLAQLKATLGSDIIAQEGADPKPENYNTFLIGTSTVTFVFQNYQVAPYAAGMQKVSFPRK